MGTSKLQREMEAYTNVFVILACFAVGIQSKCAPDDKAALMWIYNNLGGEDWYDNTNWDEDNDPCDKSKRGYGVGFYDPCNKYRDGQHCYAGRITSIKLKANNVVG